jgi:hypothetical protein
VCQGLCLDAVQSKVAECEVCSLPERGGRRPLTLSPLGQPVADAARLISPRMTEAMVRVPATPPLPSIMTRGDGAAGRLLRQD